MKSVEFVFSERSLRRLNGVHADLVAVVKRALELSEVDFAVIEGLRTIERQRDLVISGASRTLNSRHLTGHAVDLAPVVGGILSWDWKHFYPLAAAMKLAAKELKIPLTWGGDWKEFKDGPHFELDRKHYA